MREVSLPQLASYAARLPGAQLAMVVASIAAGNTAGQLWAGDGAALLWDKGNNVLYVAGERADDAARAAVAELIAGRVRPQALAAGRARFKARALWPAWEAALPALCGVALRPSGALFCRYEAGAPPEAPDVPGVTFLPVDRALLERDDLGGVAEVREEVGWMWPSLERFYARGLGRAAVADGAVVCFCTGEYVSDTMCGIGIATAPAYQGRGIASAAARRFVADALARGAAPHWECSDENVASMRVAEKAGFTRVEAARYWIGAFA